MPGDTVRDSRSLLACFDNLDLADTAERRTSVYVLEDYYGKAMADLGRENLGLGEEIREMNLITQWGKIKVRIESLDHFSLPEGYGSAPHQLKEFRDKVAHDYDYIPPQQNLEDLRELAPDWKRWLTSQTEEYHEVERELDARQTMIQIIENTLQGVLEQISWFGSYRSFASEIQSQAQELLEELEELEAASNEITVDLVHLFADAKELDQSFDYEEMEQALIDMDQQAQVDAYLEEPWLYESPDE